MAKSLRRERIEAEAALKRLVDKGLYVVEVNKLRRVDYLEKRKKNELEERR